MKGKKVKSKNMDYNNMCRICMKNKNLKSIFEYKIKSGETIDLSHKFKVCCNVDVDINDKLPSHICGVCSDALIVAYDLIVLCKSTDDLLRNNIKSETEETSEKEKEDDYSIFFKSDDEDDNDFYDDDIGCSYQTNDLKDLEEKNDDLKKESNEDNRKHEFASFDDEDEGNIIEEIDSDASEYRDLECGVDKKKYFRCYACRMKFPNRWNRELHEDLVCPKMPPGSLYKCRACSMMAVSRRVFDKHIWLVHKRKTPPKDHDYKKDIDHEWITLTDSICLGLICEICGYTCKNQSTYKRHRQTHGPKQWYQCAKCPYRSTWLHAYNVHMKYTHNGCTPLKCDHCSYQTGVKENLKKHVMKHTGERPFACSICDYRSTDRGNIKRHMVKHTNVKDYKCNICGSAYPRMNSLKQHVLQVHHQVKRLRCKYPRCNYTSFKEDLLNKHMTEKHAMPTETFTSV